MESHDRMRGSGRARAASVSHTGKPWAISRSAEGPHQLTDPHQVSSLTCRLHSCVLNKSFFFPCLAQPVVVSSSLGKQTKTKSGMGGGYGPSSDLHRAQALDALGCHLECECQASKKKERQAASVSPRWMAAHK